jgi:hypothetical protein
MKGCASCKLPITQRRDGDYMTQKERAHDLTPNASAASLPSGHPETASNESFGSMFLGTEAVPMRDDAERLEAKERNARLRLLVPGRGPK